MWRPCSTFGFQVQALLLCTTKCLPFFPILSFSQWQCWDRGSQQIIWIVDIYSPTFCCCYGAVWYTAGAMCYCYHLSTSSVYTIQLCTSLQCHCIQSHIHSPGGGMFSCCHLHFWQNVQDVYLLLQQHRGGMDTEIRVNTECRPRTWDLSITSPLFYHSTIPTPQHDTSNKNYLTKNKTTKKRDCVSIHQTILQWWDRDCCVCTDTVTSHYLDWELNLAVIHSTRAAFKFHC